MSLCSSLGTLSSALLLFVLYVGSASAAFCPTDSPFVLGLGAFAFSQTVGEGGGTEDRSCNFGGDRLSGVSNTASTLNSSASASAFFGVNRASISGTTTDAAPASSATATSVWADSILITGGTGTGIVIFGERVTGSYTEHTSSAAALSIDTGNPNQGFIGATTQGIGCIAGCEGQLFFFDQRLQFEFEFTHGVPFKLQGLLQASGGGNFVGPYRADFAHTAILDTVILPEGATLVSGSGTVYPLQIHSVPEPGALLLLLASLPFLELYRRAIS